MFYDHMTCLKPGEEGLRAFYEINDRISKGATKVHDGVRVCDYMAP